jgi:hypothetical protein
MYFEKANITVKMCFFFHMVYMKNFLFWFSKLTLLLCIVDIFLIVLPNLKPLT